MQFWPSTRFVPGKKRIPTGSRMKTVCCRKKLPLYLLLLGLFFLPSSCSLQYRQTDETSVLTNFSIFDYEQKIYGRSWGSGATCENSDICLHFEASGDLLLKTSIQDRHKHAGYWSFRKNSGKKNGTLTVTGSTDISVSYSLSSPSGILVEVHGQELHQVN